MSGFPRGLHLIISYGGTTTVFVAVLLWRMSSSEAAFTIPSWPQILIAAMWMIHFLRRTAESIWVHRFGTTSLPVHQAPGPWLYYWFFSAWVAYELSGPAFTQPTIAALITGTTLFLLAETGNAYSHILLGRLRGTPGGARAIPRGFLFEYVSCPHYFFEILIWIGFSGVCGLLSAAVLTLATIAILLVWATQRHRAYQQEFDGKGGHELYPESRRIVIPFVY